MGGTRGGVNSKKATRLKRKARGGNSHSPNAGSPKRENREKSKLSRRGKKQKHKRKWLGLEEKEEQEWNKKGKAQGRYCRKRCLANWSREGGPFPRSNEYFGKGWESAQGQN